MIVLSITARDTSRIVPVDYVEQVGVTLHFGAHEFGVHGQASHKAWADDLVLTEGVKVIVYLYGRYVKEYKG